MAGRIPTEDLYFNRTRVQDAFASLPEDYEGSNRVRISKFVTGKARKPQTRLHRPVAGTLAAIHDECWLLWDDETEERVRRVGIWGQIWALAVIWSLVCREGGRELESTLETARVVLAFGHEHGLPLQKDGEHELRDHSDEELKAVNPGGFEGMLPKNNLELLHYFLYVGFAPSIIPPLKGSRLVRGLLRSFRVPSPVSQRAVPAGI